MHSKVRHPNYATPEASLAWGYECSTKALSSLRKQDIESVKKEIHDVREAISARDCQERKKMSEIC